MLCCQRAGRGIHLMFHITKLLSIHHVADCHMPNMNQRPSPAPAPAVGCAGEGAKDEGGLASAAGCVWRFNCKAAAALTCAKTRLPRCPAPPHCCQRPLAHPLW